MDTLFHLATFPSIQTYPHTQYPTTTRLDQKDIEVNRGPKSGLRVDKTKKSLSHLPEYSAQPVT